MKKLFFLLSVLLWQHAMNGQIVLNPTFPSDGLFAVEQLYDVNLVNSSTTEIDGYLTVTIEQTGSGLVLKMSSFPIKLASGQLMYGSQLNWIPQIEYSNTDAASSLRQGGMLPVGNYIFCYDFISTDGNADVKSCQEIKIKGMSPPELMEPSNGETVSSVPLLVWLAPMMFSQGEEIRYHLRLVKLEKGQNPELGLKQNYPLVELRETKATQFLPSSDVVKFEVGETYAWQIDAFVKDFSLGATEIWTFTYGESEFKDDTPSNSESYRMVKRERNSGIYSVNSKLYFGYDNWIGEKELRYRLAPLDGDRSLQIMDLPKIDLVGGLNQLEIDCEKLGLKSGQKYSLEITDSKGVNFYLDFQYTTKENK